MTKHFGQTGVSSTLQYGKAGPLVKNDASSFKLRNAADSSYVTVSIATPTAPEHATTKAYVDAFVQGLDFKPSVRYATVAALPAVTYNNGTSGVGATLTADANGALSIDGASPSVGHEVLIKNQVSALQNGIYVVTDAGSGGSPFILTRRTDTDESAEVSGGMFVFVTAGTANADTGWVLSSLDSNANIGTDSLSFVQFSSAGVITVGAGSALDKSGNALSVRYDGVTIGVNAVGNGQLIVRSSATQGQVLLSDGTAGNAAAWGFVENLKGESTGRLIIDGIDGGGANTNYLAVTTTNGTSSPSVTIAATNAGGGGDAANVDLVIDSKGTGVIAVGATLSTISNADLVLDPNGTGLIVVGASLTTSSNADLVLDPNGTGGVVVLADINVSNNTIYTDVTNEDIHILPNGTGVISVSGTTNYEANVTDDDDIPNKKYVDDSIAGSTTVGTRRAVITADSSNDTFNIGATLPDVVSFDTYVTKIIVNVTTIFSGGSVSKARVTDGTNILMTFDENDIGVQEAYVAELPLAVTSDGAQLIVEFFESDGSTPAIPTAGSATITASFVLV